MLLDENERDVTYPDVSRRKTFSLARRHGEAAEAGDVTANVVESCTTIVAQPRAADHPGSQRSNH